MIQPPADFDDSGRGRVTTGAFDPRPSAIDCAGMPRPRAGNRSHRTPTIIAASIALVAGCASPTATTQHDRSSPADSNNRISSFRGPYRFLSNFWSAEVHFEGMIYPSVEHAYQAAKTLDVVERRRIAALPTPAQAKRAGRALPLRPDWESVKFTVMEACVRDKFTRDADLRAKLLATGDAYLEEGNNWGDRVWGVYQGEGENRLGRILMHVRDELRTDGRR